MEFPAGKDPQGEGEPPPAAVWQLELWKAFKSVGGMRKVSFNMGAFGHKGKRPTEMATNYPFLYKLDGKAGYKSGCLPSSLLDKEEYKKWSVEFREVVKEAVAEGMDGSFVEEEDLMETGAKVSKLTKQQKEEWKRRLMNDHQPYRADCSVCINAQAYGYQHRRRKKAGLYSVAIDLAGPFKQKGRDMEFDDYKYVIWLQLMGAQRST